MTIHVVNVVDVAVAAGPFDASDLDSKFVDRQRLAHPDEQVRGHASAVRGRTSQVAARVEPAGQHLTEAALEKREPLISRTARMNQTLSV